MKSIKIKISNKNRKFLLKYHPDELHVENYDEIATMCYGIIATTFDVAKYREKDELEFEKRYKLDDIVELKMDRNKFLCLRNILTVERLQKSKIQTPVKPSSCQIQFRRYSPPKKYTEIRFYACREASVKFNCYLDKLINRVFLAYMQVEVLHNNKKIVDAIRDFQAMYDLSDFDFSAETCKRFWQRHKNDAFAPYPLMM